MNNTKILIVAMIVFGLALPIIHATPALYFTSANASEVISSSMTLHSNLVAGNLTIDNGLTINTNGYGIYVAGNFVAESDTFYSDNASAYTGGPGASATSSFGGSGGGGGAYPGTVGGYVGGSTLAAGGTSPGFSPGNPGSVPSNAVISNANIITWYTGGFQNYLEGAAGGAGGEQACGGCGFGAGKEYGLFIQASNIIMSGTSVYLNGGAGRGGDCSGGGGGGGGAGAGKAIIAYNGIYASPTWNANGGSAGYGCSGGYYGATGGGPVSPQSYQFSGQPILVGSSLSSVSLSASVNGIAMEGQNIIFSVSTVGGIGPYTYNYYVINSITGTQLAFQSKSSNTFTWTVPSNAVGNTIEANVIVTDSAGESEASAYTTSILIPTVMVVHSNGQASGYNALAGTNSSRGQAFQAALSNAVSGDKIYLLGYGTYDMLGYTVNLSKGNTLTNISILGEGEIRTILTNYTNFEIGTNSVTANLSMINNGSVSFTGVPIAGWWGTPLGDSSTAYGGSVLKNVYLNTSVPGIRLWGVMNANVYLYNVTTTGGQQNNLLIDPVSGGGTTYIFNSNILADYACHNSCDYGLAAYSNVIIVNTSVIARFSSGVYGCAGIRASGTLTYIYGGLASAICGSSEADLSNAGSGAMYVNLTTKYNLTYGTITIISTGYGQTPIIVGVHSTLAANAITPANTVIDKGQSITLTAGATGGTSPYTYQWYLAADTDTSYTCSGSVLSANQVYTPSPSSTTGYCVQVTDSILSTAAITDFVTVNSAPSILSSPGTYTYPFGTAISQNTTILGGTPQFTYNQIIYSSGVPIWFSNSPYTSSTTNAMSIPFSTLGVGTYTYNVIARDSSSAAAETFNTPTYTLTLSSSTLDANAITPVNPSINSGQNITLTAGATGGTPPYSYQWYQNTCTGSVLATTQNYTTPALSSTTTYCAKVTDSASSTYAATDTVTISLSPAVAIRSLVSSKPSTVSNSSNQPTQPTGTIVPSGGGGVSTGGLSSTTTVVNTASTTFDSSTTVPASISTTTITTTIPPSSLAPQASTTSQPAPPSASVSGGFLSGLIQAIKNFIVGRLGL